MREENVEEAVMLTLPILFSENLVLDLEVLVAGAEKIVLIPHAMFAAIATSFLLLKSSGSHRHQQMSIIIWYMSSIWMSARMTAARAVKEADVSCLLLLLKEVMEEVVVADSAPVEALDRLDQAEAQD